MTPTLPDGTEQVVSTFAELRRALAALSSHEERAIARDALRDALDRDAAGLHRSDQGLEPGAILAGTWTRAGSIHAGRYFVLERLRHRELGGSQVLKRVADAHARDPLFRRMLIREATCQLRVRHPAVVAAQVLLRLDDGAPALVMDHHPGPDLGEQLRRAPLTCEAIRTLAARVHSAIEATHEAGFVHGDVSPANILMPGGNPEAALLCDFGLATPIGSTVEGLVEFGTPEFRAPETERPDTVLDVGADVFAVGSVLEACLRALPEAERDSDLCRLAALCRAISPDARPSMTALRDLVQGKTNRPQC